MLRGLQSEPKPRLLPTYFYDERGSELFRRHLRASRYYITRTETGILETHAQEIADRIGPNALLVELGSGASTKTRLLYGSAPRPRRLRPGRYFANAPDSAAQRIAATHPGLEVLPACADFTQAFTLPRPKRTPSMIVSRSPGYDPSAISADPPAAIELGESHEANRERAAGARAGLSTPNAATTTGGLVIGFDLVKDLAVLERAYDDSAGVTAEFNLNVLRRLNRDLGADFDLAAFRHQAEDGCRRPAESRCDSSARYGTNEGDSRRSRLVCRGE